MDLTLTAISIGGASIRLTAERWSYINACSDDVLGTVERPDYILRGRNRTQIAVRMMSGVRYLQVVYRELSSREGIVVSAAVTSSFDEPAVIWRPGS
jgi:hypothetical protein